MTTTNTNTIDPGEGYRLLAKGEPIRNGDEYIAGPRDEHYWTVERGTPLCRFDPALFAPFRRRVRPESDGWRFLDEGEEPRAGDQYENFSFPGVWDYHAGAGDKRRPAAFSSDHYDAHGYLPRIMRRRWLETPRADVATATITASASPPPTFRWVNTTQQPGEIKIVDSRARSWIQITAIAGESSDDLERRRSLARHVLSLAEATTPEEAAGWWSTIYDLALAHRSAKLLQITERLERDGVAHAEPRLDIERMREGWSLPASFVDTPDAPPGPDSTGDDVARDLSNAEIRAYAERGAK